MESHLRTLNSQKQEQEDLAAQRAAEARRRDLEERKKQQVAKPGMITRQRSRTKEEVLAEHAKMMQELEDLKTQNERMRHQASEHVRAAETFDFAEENTFADQAGRTTGNVRAPAAAPTSIVFDEELQKARPTSAV